jgi:hypothetical protein
LDAQEHATPFERAAAIGAALPNVRDQVYHATALYVREKFGAQALDEVERAELTASWTSVQSEWWRALGRRILVQITTPPLEFVRNVSRAIERWGKG